MCPSFQATREEMYSTRGRANLLRALVAAGGRLSNESGSAGLYPSDGSRLTNKIEYSVCKALDLCLACKGCKAECPSGVDMARLKSAFLEHYYRRRPRPLRDYVFGHFGETARLLSAMEPVLDATLRFPSLRRFGMRMLGITQDRTLPRFRSGMARRANHGSSHPVLLARDSFSHYVDGSVEDAALVLLEAAGFNVHVLDIVSSGAALISKGFLSAARRHAQSLLDELSTVDPDGRMPFVMLEPSELAAVREDYRDLIPGISDADAERLSGAKSAEELLVQSGNLGADHPVAIRTRVLFHPHCHEVAGGGMGGSSAGEPYAGMELLRHCGYEVQLLEAGCCGMGGTFGYEAEHYEISQKIGSLRLFPAIAAAGDALVAATGGACRLHITQGTSTRAEHPLVLTARALYPV